MQDALVTVEQAAEQLRLHPKTVLRYIHEGRLPATRIGKSYRIVRAQLDTFAGLPSGSSGTVIRARTTCIIDIPHLASEDAEQIATFLNATATAGRSHSTALHIDTVFDLPAQSLKIVLIGSPFDTAKLLEMLQLKLDSFS
jgi:excisionase family DNA binding protein